MYLYKWLIDGQIFCWFCFSGEPRYHFKHQSANVNSQASWKDRSEKGWREMWICYQLSDWQLNSLPQKRAGSLQLQACIPTFVPAFWNNLWHCLPCPWPRSPLRAPEPGEAIAHHWAGAVGVKKKQRDEWGSGEGTCFRGHASFSDGCALPDPWVVTWHEVSSLLGCSQGQNCWPLSLGSDTTSPGPDTLDGIPRKTPKGPPWNMPAFFAEAGLT